MLLGGSGREGDEGRVVAAKAHLLPDLSPHRVGVEAGQQLVPHPVHGEGGDVLTLRGDADDGGLPEEGGVPHERVAGVRDGRLVRERCGLTLEGDLEVDAVGVDFLDEALQLVEHLLLRGADTDDQEACALGHSRLLFFGLLLGLLVFRFALAVR